MDSIYDGPPCLRKLAHILRELLILGGILWDRLDDLKEPGTLVTIKQGPFKPSFFCLRINLNIENKIQSASEYFNAS